MHRGESGFALPTVVLSSLIVLIVLSAGLSAVGSTRVALDEQYQAQITREAAEAGVAKANACVAKHGSATWSADNPLTTESKCDGSPGITCPSAGCYLVQNGNIKTTFSVGSPSPGMYGKLNYTVNANVNLTKTSAPNETWKSLSSAVNYNSVMTAAPKISGGAGYLNIEHLALVATVDNQLYGFGSNSAYQINATGSPAIVADPIKIILPDGVKGVKKITTSGQGSSYVCIIGDDLKAYCRGSAFSSNWTKIAYVAGANYNAYDIVVNGWGNDSVCVLAGSSSDAMQVYCAGGNEYGSLGKGAAGGVSLTGNFEKFILPGVLTAKKVFSQNAHVCVIASNDKLYCAGANYSLQIPGALGGDEIYTPEEYQIPSMGSVARKVVDVTPAYHQNQSTLFVLADDGTIWMSGERYSGMSGNGNITGDASPDLFGGGPIKYKANQSYCIDNNNGSSSDGNSIQLWSCDPNNDAQTWFYTKGTQAILNPKTGKCIDLPSSNATNGVFLQLYSCNGTNAQKWILQSDGSFHSAVNNSYCIDLPAQVTGDGKRLEIWQCNGSAAQQFTVDTNVQPWDGIITLQESACGLRSQYAPGVWCAGQNDFGQLGGGTCSDIESRLVAMSLPVGRKIDISKLTYEWKYQFGSLQIIADDGQVYGAGANTYGKLGNGSMSATQCTVVKFQLPVGVKAIDMSTRDEYSTYVLGDNGRVYATGRNDLGQLGDGTTTNRSTPVSVNFPVRGLAY